MATTAATTANGTSQIGPSFVADELTIGKMESYNIEAMTGRGRSCCYCRRRPRRPIVMVAVVVVVAAVVAQQRRRRLDRRSLPSSPPPPKQGQKSPIV